MLGLASWRLEELQLEPPCNCVLLSTPLYEAFALLSSTGH